MSQIHEVIEYDPTTGLLRWRVTCGQRARAGDIAGAKNQKGYITVGYRGKEYRAHRVAWRIMTGSWPRHLIDHRNLNKSDNRWDNLREATSRQNNANRPKNELSIAKGVTRRSTGRYQARVDSNGRCYYLGTYDTVEEASAAYATKANELFGEFARFA